MLTNGTGYQLYWWHLQQISLWWLNFDNHGSSCALYNSYCLGLGFKLVYEEYFIVIILQCLHINEISKISTVCTWIKKGKLSSSPEGQMQILYFHTYYTVCHKVFLTAVLYVWHFHFLSSEFPRKDPQCPDAREENEIYMVKVICDVNNDTWLQMPLSLHHKIMMQSAWELRLAHCHPQFVFNQDSLMHVSTSKNDFRSEYRRKHLMVSTKNNVVHL